MLLPYRDQGTCGSCYALCAASMLSDRLSILTNGEKKIYLSHQDIINCGQKLTQQLNKNETNKEYIANLVNNGSLENSTNFVLLGCSGGLLVSVCNYLVIAGLPSEKNVPYLHSTSPEFGNEHVSKDYNYCDEKRIGLDKYFAKSVFQLTFYEERGFPNKPISLSNDVLFFNNRNMKTSIFLNGTIISGMNIYTDFLYYPNIEKIYRKKDYFTANGKLIQNKYQGSHCISLIGYGTTLDENNTKIDYWIGRNTWKNWGLDKQGYFLIERGTNMVNIEYDSVALLPDLSKSPSNDDTFTFFASANQDNLLLIILIVVIVLIAIVFISLAIYFIVKTINSKKLKNNNNYLNTPIHQW